VQSGGSLNLLIDSLFVCWTYSSTLKVEAVHSSETSENLSGYTMSHPKRQNSLLERDKRDEQIKRGTKEE
jgi:hypothetical protein